MPMSPHGSTYAQALNLFRSNQAARHSTQARDYCASAPAALQGLRRARIFEFPWGFVAESGASGAWLVWNLYVAGAGQGNAQTDACFDAAHGHLIAAEMSQVVDPTSQRRLQITYINGRASNCTASYACMVPSMTVAARAWLSSRLLAALWPQAIEYVRDQTCNDTVNFCTGEGAPKTFRLLRPVQSCPAAKGGVDPFR